MLFMLAACGGGSGGDSSSSSASSSTSSSTSSSVSSSSSSSASSSVSSSSSVSAPSALSYPSPQTYGAGTAITTLTPTVTGVVTSYSVSPSLPPGLLLNASSGQLTGTPTTATANASYTITAQNSAGSTTFALSITVNAATLFWLEPTTSTIIGMGQVINVFSALKNSAADPYPSYVDPTLITWTSSNPVFASINSNGAVIGLNEGTTTITAQYQGHSSQLTVQVSGAFISRNIAVSGQGTRHYSIYVPPFGSDAGPYPVIVALHGGGGSAMIQASTSQLNKLAHDQKLYVVYLDGTGVIQTYNGGSCCGSAQTNNIDDVLYVRTVLDDIEANYTVNAAKIFATGFSNGGIMSHRLACAVADRFAGIAAVSGGSGQFDFNLNQYYACTPARPIPILHIHATNDRNYPFAGGLGEGLSATPFYPIDSTIADWITRNNLTTQVTTEHVTATTTCYHYSVIADTSKPSAPVTLCKLDPPDVYDATNQIVFGGGHSWPGGVRSPAANSDVPVTDFNAGSYMWGLFNQ
jgi:polyhydroxybutyrate depolymerase